MIPPDLHEELTQIFGSHDLTGAFQSVGLLPVGVAIKEIRTILSWYRAGAESFIFSFELYPSRGSAIPLLLKAYVTLSLGNPIDRAFEKILLRRDLLATHGFGVPALYAARRGVVLEQFIPFSLDDWLRTAGTHERERMLLELRTLGEGLDLLGFVPTCLYSDVRTDGKRPFLVDFGEDLGPAGQGRSKSHNVTQLAHWLDAHARGQVRV